MPTQPSRLVPRGEPDRRIARARAFQADIRRLYDGGYTCKAICESLADAGVVVSESTVRRELARGNPRHGHLQRPERDGFLTPKPGDGIRKPDPLSVSRLTGPSDRRTGKEIAEEFFKGYIDNPLIRARLKRDGA